MYRLGMLGVLSFVCACANDPKLAERQAAFKTAREAAQAEKERTPTAVGVDASSPIDVGMSREQVAKIMSARRGMGRNEWLCREGVSAAAEVWSYCFEQCPCYTPAASYLFLDGRVQARLDNHRGSQPPDLPTPMTDGSVGAKRARTSQELERARLQREYWASEVEALQPFAAAGSSRHQSAKENAEREYRAASERVRRAADELSGIDEEGRLQKLEVAKQEARKKAFEDPSFRSTDGYQETRWGMSKAEVLRLVPGAKRDRAILTLNGKVAGYPATTSYYFAQNKLTSAIVRFSPVGAARSYEDAFTALKAALERKYGVPDASGNIGAEWSGEKTTIRLDYRPLDIFNKLTVTYASVELEGLEESTPDDRGL